MERTVFAIDDDYIELSSLLKALALCATGGEAKQLIAGGHVRVDGEIEQRRKRKLRAGSVVECAGQCITVITAQV